MRISCDCGRKKNSCQKQSDIRDWLHKLYTITEVIIGTISSYHIKNLFERYS